MPSEDAKRMKEPFLLFLDLIIEYRIDAFLGKTGLTYIPQLRLDEVSGLELETYIDVLLLDKVLYPIQKKDGKLLPWDKITNSEGLQIVLGCMKSAEEIRVYKNSLNLKDGWVGVRIDPPERRGTKYKMYKGGIVDKFANLSQVEGQLMEYLKNEGNRNKSRKVIANELGLAVGKISNLKNSLRRKLRKLNFSEESISEMLPTY